MRFSQQVYWGGLPFHPPVDHVLSELSTMTCLPWVDLHGMACSFIELFKPLCHYKEVIHEGIRFKGLELVNSVPENYGQRSIILYRKQKIKPSPRKRKVRRQGCYLRRTYKYLKREDKQKAREKGKDISN